MLSRRLLPVSRSQCGSPGANETGVSELSPHATGIQPLRANAVSIVNRKPVALQVANGLPKWPQSPSCVWMGSEIEVGKPARLWSAKNPF